MPVHSQTAHVSACADCVITAANGYEPEHWGYVPRTMPLQSVPEGWAGPWADTDPDTGESVEPHFSYADCDTCGETLGGDRYDATLVRIHTTTMEV